MRGWQRGVGEKDYKEASGHFSGNGFVHCLDPRGVLLVYTYVTTYWIVHFEYLKFIIANYILLQLLKITQGKSKPAQGFQREL